MKSNNSKIATIVYAQYEENVDMNNPLFKSEELMNLFDTDKDIIRIEFREGGELTEVVTRKFENTDRLLDEYSEMISRHEMDEEYAHSRWFNSKHLQNNYAHYSYYSDAVAEKNSNAQEALLSRIERMMKNNREGSLYAYDIYGKGMCYEMFDSLEAELLENLKAKGFRKNKTK